MSIAIPSLRGAIAVPGWAKNELWRRARAVPSLDLRFAENKSLVDATTGLDLVTFTRTSDGTATNSSGNLIVVPAGTPRFDHNPLTGESLGLLVEEQRTNLFTRSEEFGTAWSTLNSSVSADATVAPNGTSTADKIVENSTTNVHGVSRGGSSESLVNGTVYTFSVYAKAAERSFIWMQALNSFAKSYFNLSTGVVSASGAGHTSTITPAGNGWYRCAITFTSDQTNNSYRAIGMAQASGTESYAGDNASGLFLWGAQLEAGAFPTSYIPTGASAVTRAADVCSISGSNFSSWYNQAEGTVFSSFSIPASITAGGARVYNISNNNNTSQAWLRLQGGTNRVYEVVDASTQQALLSAGTFSSGALYKGAVALKSNDFGFSENSSTPTVDTTGTLGTHDRMGIGMDATGIAPLNGHIRRLVYWGQRLPNNVLQAITQ
jgi:hypothetical protein